MKTQTMLISLMVVLILMAGVQAYQVNEMTDIITSGSIAAPSSISPASSSAQSSAISSLPTQVGGCG